MQVEFIEAAQLVGTFLGIFCLMLMVDVIAIAKGVELPQEQGWALVGWFVNKAGWGLLHIGLYIALYAFLMLTLDQQYRTGFLTPVDKEITILGLFKVHVREMNARELWEFETVVYHFGSIMYGVVSVMFYWLTKSIVDMVVDVVRNPDDWFGRAMPTEPEEVAADVS